MAIKENYFVQYSFGDTHVHATPQHLQSFAATFSANQQAYLAMGITPPSPNTAESAFLAAYYQTIPSFNAQSTQPGNQANNAVQKDPKK